MERRMKRTPRRSAETEQSPAKKMAKNMTLFVFLTCLVVIVIMFLYYRHKNSGQPEQLGGTTKAEVDRLAEKDLEVGYPDTPTELLKLLGRLNQCMYNTDLSDEQFDALLNQLRMLYSTSLLDQNPLEEHRKNLREEIESFDNAKTSIVSYTVDKGGSVKYETVEGQECAYLQMAYFLKENGKSPKSSKSFQDYVLVKENGDWKIMAFKRADTSGEGGASSGEENG